MCTRFHHVNVFHSAIQANFYLVDGIQENTKKHTKTQTKKHEHKQILLQTMTTVLGRLMAY